MRFLLIILSFIFIHISAYAELVEKDGYYVTMEDDTIYGTIKVRIDYLDELYYARIQYGAYYEDSLGNVTRLLPEHVKRICFYHQYQFVNFVSLEFYKNHRLFLHSINEEGAVKLYVHYKDVIDTRTDYGTLAFYLITLPASSEKDFFYMLKEDGSSVKYSKYSGRKNISLFFDDYPDLHSKIQRGLYGYTAVYRMVREYNKWHREKQTVSIN